MKADRHPVSAMSIHESLYVSRRSGLVTNCSQSLTSASVVDARILRIGSPCPPGSLRSEPLMRQTARRKRAVLPGRSLRGTPSRNPDGVAACGMRAGPSHALSERLFRTRVDLLAVPACKSEVSTVSRRLRGKQTAKRLLHRKYLICRKVGCIFVPSRSGNRCKFYRKQGRIYLLLVGETGRGAWKQEELSVAIFVR
jgi:hypothetical protein